MIGTVWSLLPPVVAIALALKTKEVYSSLFIGIILGAVQYCISMGTGFDGFLVHLTNHTVGEGDDAKAYGLIHCLSDPWNVGILVAYFMQRVKIFEEKVAEQLAPLTIQNGGPIIMVQVENEYGSYGEDKAYVSEIRDVLKANWYKKNADGKLVGPALFQCDWASNFTKNGLDDLVWTMNFGTGANIDNQFRRLGELRPDAPKMCSEFWSGWFDKWGARHETRPAKNMVKGMDEMLSKGMNE